jgi:hypothetical protein
LDADLHDHLNKSAKIGGNLRPISCNRADVKIDSAVIFGFTEESYPQRKQPLKRLRFSPLFVIRITAYWHGLDENISHEGGPRLYRGSSIFPMKILVLTLPLVFPATVSFASETVFAD